MLRWIDLNPGSLPPKMLDIGKEGEKTAKTDGKNLIKSRVIDRERIHEHIISRC